MARKRKETDVLRVRLLSEDPWEALLNRRLETLTAAQRGRWVRGLLVAGFREECLVRLQLAEPPPFTRLPRQRSQVLAEPMNVNPMVLAEREGKETPSGKPLARLQCVIGR